MSSKHRNMWKAIGQCASSWLRERGLVDLIFELYKQTEGKVE